MSIFSISAQIRDRETREHVAMMGRDCELMMALEMNALDVQDFHAAARYALNAECDSAVAFAVCEAVFA